MLNAQTPHRVFLIGPGKADILGASPGEPAGGGGTVADGGGKTDPAGRTEEKPLQADQLAENLPAPVGAHQGMHFIDHHEPQVAKKPRQVVLPVDEHTLQAFRGDLQDPFGVLQGFGLVGGRNISVPVGKRNAAGCKKLGKPFKLVVDQAFQGSDVQHPETAGRVVEKL